MRDDKKPRNDKNNFNENEKIAKLIGFPTKSGIKAGGLEYDFTNGGIVPPPPEE